jgi:hypothetical protein
MNRAKPLPGRLSERAIRSTLNTIRKRMRDPNLSNKQFLELNRHYERLQGELRTVGTEKEKAKLKAQLAQLETKTAEVQPNS